jgi:hypothetical protein
MATKTKTKEKKSKKKAFKKGVLPLMVAETSKKGSFDAGQHIAELTALLHTSGWAILKKIFNQNIEVLERQIIKKIDGQTGKELTDIEVDRLRDKLGYLEEVIGTPENYIKQLKESDVEPENFDPFFSSMSEMQGRRDAP